MSHYTLIAEFYTVNSYTLRNRCKKTRYTEKN